MTTVTITSHPEAGGELLARGLRDGAYYWVKMDGGEPWEPALLEDTPGRWYFTLIGTRGWKLKWHELDAIGPEIVPDFEATA